MCNPPHPVQYVTIQYNIWESKSLWPVVVMQRHAKMQKTWHRCCWSCDISRCITGASTTFVAKVASVNRCVANFCMSTIFCLSQSLMILLWPMCFLQAHNFCKPQAVCANQFQGYQVVTVYSALHIHHRQTNRSSQADSSSRQVFLLFCSWN